MKILKKKSKNIKKKSPKLTLKHQKMPVLVHFKINKIKPQKIKK